MSDQIRWFVGFDWATKQHRACLLDADGKRVAQRDVTHDGAGLLELCTWLLEKTGGRPVEIAVAIETPARTCGRGAVGAWLPGVCHQSQATRPLS